MKPTKLWIVVQNMCSLALADIGNKVLLFLFFLISARYLGPKDFGVFSLAIAITNILIVITDFGTSSLGTREGARDYNVISKYISNIIFLKIFFCIIVLISGWFIINKLGYTLNKIRAVVMLFPSVVFLTFVQTFNSVFQATEKMFFIPLGKLIDGIILIGGVFLLIHLKSTTSGFIILYTIAALMVFIYSFLIVWNKFTHFTVAYDKKYLKQILRDTLPFGLGTVFSTFYYWNSSPLLSLWRGDAETGLFTASFRLVLGTTFIPIAFAGALYPILSKTFISSKESLENIFFVGLRYMTMIGVPICIFTTALSEKAIYFFYGSNYTGSIPLLRILIWWAGIVYLNAIFAHYFYSTNQQTVIAKQTFFAVIINLILNLMLIKRIGVIGACFSIVIAEIGSFLYLIYMVTKSIPLFTKQIKKLAETTIKAIVASIPSMVFIITCKQMHLIPVLLVAVSIYIIIFYIINGFSPSDKNLAKNLWRELKLIIYGQL